MIDMKKHMEMQRKYVAVRLTGIAKDLSTAYVNRVDHLDQDISMYNLAWSASVGVVCAGGAAIHYHGSAVIPAIVGISIFALTSFGLAAHDSFHNHNHQMSLYKFNYALSLSSKACLESIERYGLSRIESLSEYDVRALNTETHSFPEHDLCKIMGEAFPILSEILVQT